MCMCFDLIDLLDIVVRLRGLKETNDKTFLTPPSAARGGLKENSQNPDSGSKSSENQNNDAISLKKGSKVRGDTLNIYNSG